MIGVYHGSGWYVLWMCTCVRVGERHVCGRISMPHIKIYVLPVFVWSLKNIRSRRSSSINELKCGTLHANMPRGDQRAMFGGTIATYSAEAGTSSLLGEAISVVGIRDCLATGLRAVALALAGGGLVLGVRGLVGGRGGEGEVLMGDEQENSDTKKPVRIQCDRDVSYEWINGTKGTPYTSSHEFKAQDIHRKGGKRLVCVCIERTGFQCIGTPLCPFHMLRAAAQSEKRWHSLGILSRMAAANCLIKLV